MTIIYLVRHAKPAATWGEATDPGLDALGVQQAKQTADDLSKRLPLLKVFTSPLQRCRETAQPLALLWNMEAVVLPEVAEIPSPPLSMSEKRQWLTNGMQGMWAQMQATAPAGSANFSEWRERLLNALRAQTKDCVIYSHYIAINVVVGAAQGHDRVISFRPDHASVTTVEVTSDRFNILNLGREAESGILLGK